MDVEVAAMTADHVPAAGALVAARQRAQRALHPLLPAAPADPAVASDLVAATLRFCSGVVALDSAGVLAGFLTGFEQAPDPSSPFARYGPARAAVHLVQGHAVADDVEPFAVYAALFAELARHDLEAGIVDHITHVPIGEPGTEAAWAALGFGRVSTVAVRDLSPLGRATSASIEVRVATPDELDVVDRLVDEESVFHAASPIFRPYVHDQTAAAVRADLAAQLASDDHAFLVARRAGEDVGVVSIGPPLGSPLYVPDGAAYIASTAVLPSARRSGAGATLADAAFTWAREHGHRAVCLHFATANATSSAFWPAVGFEPVMTHLRRRLDERILTNRPGR